MAMQTYAITDGISIKIGKSENVSARVSQLQTANARPLMLLGCLDGNVERDAHRFLERCGVRRFEGEWFEDCQRTREALTNMGFRSDWSHPRLEDRMTNANAEELECAYRNGINEGFGRGIRHALEAYSDDIKLADHWQDYSWDHRVEEHW